MAKTYTRLKALCDVIEARGLTESMLKRMRSHRFASPEERAVQADLDEAVLLLRSAENRMREMHGG